MKYQKQDKQEQRADWSTTVIDKSFESLFQHEKKLTQIQSPNSGH